MGPHEKPERSSVFNGHPSSSKVQVEKEQVILRAISRQVGVNLNQRVRLDFGDSWMEVDGASVDETVLVEVYAHIGKLKGAHKHKISTDALKLIALGESRPNARLIIALADQDAARSIVGWKAAVLKHNRVEILVAELAEKDRAELLTTQSVQSMVNPTD